MYQRYVTSFYRIYRRYFNASNRRDIVLLLAINQFYSDDKLCQ